MPDWPEGTIFHDYDRHASKPTECQANVTVPGFPELMLNYNVFERLTAEQIFGLLWQLYQSHLNEHDKYTQLGYW